MKRTTVVSLRCTVTVLLVGMLLGCGKSARLSGKYVADDPTEYVDLKKDGTFYARERIRLPGGITWGEEALEQSGKWKVEGDEVILTDPMGVVERLRIEGDSLVDSEGKTWRRK